MATNTTIDTGAGGQQDVRDFSQQLSKVQDLTTNYINNTFKSVADLQKEIANKQSSYNKEIRDAEMRALQATSTASRQKELANIQLLERQKASFDSLSATLQDLQKAEKERIKVEEDKKKQEEKEKRDKRLNVAERVGDTLGLGGMIRFFTGGWLNAVVTSLGFIKDILFANDRLQTDIARSLGVGKDESVGILDAYRGIAANSGQTLTFAKDLIEANSQITSQYKIMVPITGNILTNQTFMTKELGLQVDEASRLNSIFLLNGNQGKQGLDIVYKQVAEYANQNKILFSGKAILSEISKVSGQIRASFKGSTEEIAKSVIEATRLGTTLDQTRSMSESLLNFESSIDNELKAELLTGQQLNLEKARALALSGKYVEAGKEMLDQAGGLNNFQKLNVIQQRALAESVGLTGDQLADVLFKQSETGKYAEDLADKYEAINDYVMASRIRKGELDAQGLKAAEATLSSQQKFEASMERVKEIFAGFVNNGLLDKLASFAEAFTRRLASGSLAGALFHNYSTDISEMQAKKDAEKLGTGRGTKYNEEAVGVLKGYAKDAEAKAKEDTSGWLDETMVGLEALLDTKKDYNQVKADVELRNTEKYYKEMIALLTQMSKNPIPATLSTSVLNQHLADARTRH